MKPGDDHALVVPGVAQQCRVSPIAIGYAGDVFVHPGGAELELRSDRPVRVLYVEVGPEAGSASEHRVQVERRCARVGRYQRVLRHAERRGLIEGDVVIDELPHERRPGGHRRVIRIGAVRIRRRRIPVHRRIDNQRLRSGRELIAGVHDPARPTHLQQRRADPVVRLDERRSFGKTRPKSALLAGTPCPRAYRPGPIAPVAAASAGEPGKAAPAATNPAPVAPSPFRKSRRDGPGPRVSALICLPFFQFAIGGYLPTVPAAAVPARLLLTTD